jgi:ABC-type phosphate/phosphonate transport system substrate-binding protein
MKKWMLLLLILSTMMLSACSLLEGANNSIDYVNQATQHINKLSNFAEQAPQMIKDAALNPETKQELENQLNGLKKEIEQFNLKSVPSFAKDIHQQLVDKNEVLLQEINKVVENGHLALDKLQNSQILTTINDITGLINRIKNLGS